MLLNSLRPWCIASEITYHVGYCDNSMQAIQQYPPYICDRDVMESGVWFWSAEQRLELEREREREREREVLLCITEK